MNKLNTLLLVILLASFTFSQNFSVLQNTTPGGSPNVTDALVTIHYDGDNNSAIGDGGTTFIAGARFTPAVLGPLTGGELQFFQFYYYQAATGLTIKIYDAGTSTAPGALLLDQPLNIASLTFPGWNEIELTDYISITGNDLWICLEVADATGANYPLGCDNGPNNPDGDWVNDTGVWEHLSGFGLNYNWNIRGVVEDSPAPSTILFADNFDSYTAGTGLVSQNPSFWQTWDGGAGEDPLVSNAFSNSSPNSVVIIPDNDLVKTFGATPYTTGNYKISFFAYIPAGKAGYFNTLAVFGSTSQWAMECYFDVGGTGRMFGGSSTAVTFSWPIATWFPVEVNVDLDADLGIITINGTSVLSWQWSLGASGTAIQKTLHASDFFGDNANCQMFIDDYKVEDLYIVPVELSAFVANVNKNTVTLNWTTESELNNNGFEVQRKFADDQFVTIGIVKGAGTTTNRTQYSYTDVDLVDGNYYYRLKQVDFSGNYEYSNEIFVEVNAPTVFGIEQNYPNPFNPTTNIKYSVTEPSMVKLAVYNMLGEEVSVLKNEYMTSGTFNAAFDAASLPSGIYICKLETSYAVSAIKMMLMK
ncbi:MAG: T9SS type A sorting domain-containing protein [Ignavibacteriaceae bacterium]|nr:T9SS type A sorting domain-containing protein [Ignavibacteriaceae bacterium]